MDKPIIYQMLPRLWGNMKEGTVRNGSAGENGTGKFSGIDNAALEYLKWLGCSHVWYTGIIRHATPEDSMGCIPSNPQIVKGKAGSPYAITDYYDVNPYLADNPAERMQEFEELLERTHEAGLKVIIDFVPNHVSRDYGKVSTLPGHPVLGCGDDKTVHWSLNNDFFYYPGQKLKLPVHPAEGHEEYIEMPAMATGNNCYSPEPGITDWYETIKINYCETYTGTWEKMYDIVRYWAQKGVDGFRCDMVELVPPEFFRWLIEKTKGEFPDIVFIAEVYRKELYRKYIREVGFDFLYDKSGLYDTIRAIVGKNISDNGLPVELWQSAEGITRNWQYLGDLQPYMLNFLENHDEQRFASDFFGKDGKNSLAALYTSLYMNRAPFMIYMGEELGEKGMDEEGFSGKDGRTTIFDWWSVESLKKLNILIHSGMYNVISSANSVFANADERNSEEYMSALEKARLTQEEAYMFGRFTEAIRLAAENPAIKSGMTYDLCYCNSASEGFDKCRHYAFLRDWHDETLLIAANFSSMDAAMELAIPQHAFEWLELPVTDMLNPDTRIRINVPAMDGAILKLSAQQA